MSDFNSMTWLACRVKIYEFWLCFEQLFVVGQIKGNKSANVKQFNDILVRDTG